MRPMLPSFFAASVLVLGACSTVEADHGSLQTSPPRHQAEASLTGVLPMPKTALTIGANDASLADVLERVSDSTGVIYSSHSVVSDALRATRLTLTQSVTIEPADVYPWFESLLVQNGFFLGVHLGTHPTLVEVGSLRGPHESPPPALQLPADQLEFAQRHPAVLMTTTLELPHTDVRTLGNSLRGLTGNDASGSVMPVANTNSIVLRGQGRALSSIADILLRIDATAANAVEARRMIDDEVERSKSK